MARRVGGRSSSRIASTGTPNATAAASRPTRSSRNSDAAAILATPTVETPTPQVKSLRLRQRQVIEPDPPTPPQVESDEPMPDGDEPTPPAAEDDDEEQSEATADADDGPTTGQNSDDAAGEAEEEEGGEDEGEQPQGEADGAEADGASNPPTPYGEELVSLRGRGSRGRRGRGGRGLIDWGTPRSPAAGTGDEASEAGATPIVKRRRGRPPVNGVSSHTPRSARGGGFRGRPRGRGSHSQVTRHQIDKEGNTLPIVGDEVAAPPDPEGELKVDINGYLLGGREYRVRTFPVIGRGDRLYMLSTEPARCTGYRDSYLFFNKHMPLHKILLDDHEKHDLIDRDLMPHSYKGRLIGIVTARSVFREFGSKIVVGGKKVVDDYYAQKSRDRGDVEGELADPFDRLPPEGQPYNKNQYVAWHGASQVYHSQQGGVPGTGGHGLVGGLGVKRKPVITSANWMYEHALAASRFNSGIAEARKSTHDGVYDPHTNLTHYPRAMQPTRVRWEYVADDDDDENDDDKDGTLMLAQASTGTKRSFSDLVNGYSSADTNGNTLHHKIRPNEPTANGTLTPPDSSHGAAHANGREALDNADSGDRGRNDNNAKRIKLNHEEADMHTTITKTPFRTGSTIFPKPSQVLSNNFLVVDTHLVTAPPSLTTASVPNSNFCGDVQSTLPDPYDPAYAELPEDCRQELLEARQRERQWREEWLYGAPFHSSSSNTSSVAAVAAAASASVFAPGLSISSSSSSSSTMTTSAKVNGVTTSSPRNWAAAAAAAAPINIKREMQHDGTSEDAWVNFKSISGRAGMLRSLGLFI